MDALLREDKVRARFWVELGCAGLSALLCIMTLISRDWIEILFQVDPDNHSGSLEWSIVAVLFVVTALLGILARSEWRPRASRQEVDPR
jgi:hypothetical protein